MDPRTMTASQKAEELLQDSDSSLSEDSSENEATAVKHKL